MQCLYFLFDLHGLSYDVWIAWFGSVHFFFEQYYCD